MNYPDTVRIIAAARAAQAWGTSPERGRRWVLNCFDSKNPFPYTDRETREELQPAGPKGVTRRSYAAQRKGGHNDDDRGIEVIPVV